jgi:hypothetical protein
MEDIITEWRPYWYWIITFTSHPLSDSALPAIILHPSPMPIPSLDQFQYITPRVLDQQESTLQIVSQSAFISQVFTKQIAYDLLYVTI